MKRKKETRVHLVPNKRELNTKALAHLIARQIINQHKKEKTS